MNPEEFARLVRSLAALPRESEWVELKHNNADPQKIGENVSAVSNGAALLRKPMSYVLWGVDDDSRDLIGTSFRPRDTKIGNQDLENWLAVQLDPKIDVRIHEGQVDGHEMVLFEVPPATQMPTRFRKDEYIRVGSYTKPLRDHPRQRTGALEAVPRSSLRGRCRSGERHGGRGAPPARLSRLLPHDGSAAAGEPGGHPGASVCGGDQADDQCHVHLLALWRAAWDAGLIEEQPRGVRKIRLEGAVECWTPEEVATLLRAVDRLFVHQDGTDKAFRFSHVSKRLFFRSLILAGWDGGQRLGDTLAIRTDKLLILDGGAGEYSLQQRKSKRWVRFALRPETVAAIGACCESGKGAAVGRVEPWRKVCAKGVVQRGIQRIAENAQAVDGIRYGTFQWLRRSSVTARECIEKGAGTLAAGHGQSYVTLRHYLDTKQLPAAPLPPAIHFQEGSGR